MNLDTLLLEIDQYGFDNLPKILPGKDIKILKSITSIVKSKNFITENQGRLLHKILLEHAPTLSEIHKNLNDSLLIPVWSRPFRQLDQTKKMFISKNADAEPVLAVEFANNSQIRKSINIVSPTLSDNLWTDNGRLWFTTLTEKNIVALVDCLLPFNFDIQETILNHYKTIKTWNFDEVSIKYSFTDLVENNLTRALTQEIGNIADVSDDVIQDRSTRYGYFTKLPKNQEKTIKNSIINRTTANVWIDSKVHQLEDILTELISLKRFPVLIVLDSQSVKSSIDGLKILEKSLENLSIKNNVGVHFRLDSVNGKEFNEIIAKRKYNAKLDSTTDIAVISSTKLPKFFIKNAWTPMSVISLNTKLRYSKTAVYTNCCDLVIEYTDTESIINFKDLWLQ